MSSLVFRRFHKTSIRNLLFLEARLAALEAHQQLLDKFHDSDLEDPSTREGHSWENFGRPPGPASGSTSWEELARFGINHSHGSNYPLGIPTSALREWEIRGNSAKTPKDIEYILGKVEKDAYYMLYAKRNAPEGSLLAQAQWKTALAINEATKDYQEANLRYRDMLALPHPAERTLKAIQGWFQPKGSRKGPFSKLSAMSTIFGGSEEDQKRFPRTVEAISLFTPGDEDPFTRLLTRWDWLMTKLKRQYDRAHPAYSVVPEKRIRRVITVFTTITALFFLVAAIFVLWVCKKTHVFVSLIVLSTFVVLFAGWLSIGTANKSEVFAASAAYAAVLVVFISQT